MVFVKNYSLLRNCSTKPDLRIKQYKHIRNVMTAQGYATLVAVLGTYVIRDCKSKTFRKLTFETVSGLTLFGSAALFGRAITVTRKVGRVYRFGTMLYNSGMLPFKCAHFINQSPMIILDLIMIGEV